MISALSNPDGMFFCPLLENVKISTLYRVPPNVRFEVDDVEAEWTYHQKFDYIHCRFMGNAIQDWPKLVGQCFEYVSTLSNCTMRKKTTWNCSY